MAAVTFDSLKFANRLKAAGIPPAQAEAEAEALSDALEDKFALISEQQRQLAELTQELRKLEAASKHDLEAQALRSDNAYIRLEAKVDKGFAEVNGKLSLHNWMLGVIVVGIVALILKSFF